MWAAGWEFFRPAQKPLLSRVKPRPGTKGPFVPGRGFTRDKRPPHIFPSSFAFLLTLGFSSAPVLLPPPREPSTAAIDVAAAQRFRLRRRPAPPTARAEHRRHRRRRRPDPRPHAAAQSHRRRRNALATIPCSPSTRRYRPSQPTPRTQR